MKGFKNIHRKTKLLSISLLALTLFSFLPVTSALVVQSPLFSDVDAANTYYNAVNYLKNNNTIQGYADGTFKPYNRINRAEFIKFLIAASPDNAKRPSVPLTFSDLEAGTWYIPYLQNAIDRNIISGYPDGTFKPNQNINFAEASKIIANGLSLIMPDYRYPGEPWYEPYVRALADQDAIPTTITRFDQPITRGEMAEIIYRLKNSVTTEPSQTYEILAGQNKGQSTLSEGEVTLQGTYGGTSSSGIPDTGSTVYLNTQNYGQVKVGMPGFINCADKQIYTPSQIGEALEVHGNYTNDIIDICSSSAYYLKSTSQNQVACVTAGGIYNATVNPPTHCCSGLISYFPSYSQGQTIVGASGICLNPDTKLQQALNIYNTPNECTTSTDVGQSTDLPYSNLNGYSFPMKSFKAGCQVRCDVDVDQKTAKLGWMCTGLLPNAVQAPVLVSPDDKAFKAYNPCTWGNIQFSWEPAQGAVSYTLYLQDNDSITGAQITKTYTTSDSSYSWSIKDNVWNGTNPVTWWVRAYAADGSYKDSVQRSYSLEKLDCAL